MPQRFPFVLKERPDEPKKTKQSKIKCEILMHNIIGSLCFWKVRALGELILQERRVKVQSESFPAVK